MSLLRVKIIFLFEKRRSLAEPSVQGGQHNKYWTEELEGIQNSDQLMVFCESGWDPS